MGNRRLRTIDELSNTLVVSAGEGLLENVMATIDALDLAARPTVSRMQVLKVDRNVNAGELTKRLKNLVTKPPQPQQPRQPAQPQQPQSELLVCRSRASNLGGPVIGMAWGLGGWLLTPFLQKIGPEGAQQLRERVAAEIKTTFASTYTKEVSLVEALQLSEIAVYGKQATGEKYLITPNKGLAAN